MPEKYYIKTEPVSPRLPRIGKYGIVDWREDCARCHNCVKKACVYDRYREESVFIRDLDDVHSVFNECMGCFSCVQNCTKGILCLSINSEYENLGNKYWVPSIFRSTWLQAETGKVPVSGAGYRGKFSGHGFDSMWTDMSEIVRPTRDGIHGREYISTSVDIGRKPSYLTFKEDEMMNTLPPLISLPLPVIFDLTSSVHTLPQLEPSLIETARRTNLITLIDSVKYPMLKAYEDDYFKHIAFYLNPTGSEIPIEVLRKTKLLEIPDQKNIIDQIKKLKAALPEIIISVRIPLTGESKSRSMELAKLGVDVLHLVADLNGNEIGAEKPRFIKDILRDIHAELIRNDIRDEVTIIAGGGIGLSEHLAKAIICGADLVSINLPFLIAIECKLCDSCKPGDYCPAKLDKEIDLKYSVGRMTNLMGAWHWQIVEVMGAMGMREVRRLRGDVGRAMFKEELEKEIYEPIFKQEF
jgi:ferredoxin